MASETFDFALFGSTPVAKLTAGLLASVHGARIVLVGRSDAAFRIARSFDVSVGPITRPETWRLLGSCVPEVARLLTRLGKRTGWSRLDPIFHSVSAPGRQALAHVQRMAEGYGHQAERLPEGSLGGPGEGVVLRDAIVLHWAVLEPVIEAWLANAGVRRIEPDSGRSVSLVGAGVEIATASDMLSARTVVLADDESLLGLLDIDTLGTQLVPTRYGALVADIAGDRPALMMVDLDNGLQSLQRRAGAIQMIAPLPVGHGPDRALPPLMPRANLVIAGRTSFDRLRAHDGAPVFGRLSENGPTLVSALGSHGAFLAPAIARWLAAKCTSTEAAFFAAHHARRPSRPSPVTDVTLPVGLSLETAA